MKKASRFLAVLLVLCMVLSMIPAVFAADQEGTTYVLASTLKAGDEVIIFNPAVNMALNKEIVSTYYKGGTQVTPVDGAITTSSTSIVWTVSADGDGFNLANDEGQKLSIDGTWNSIPYDKGNDAWPVSAATTEGCVYVVNENGKYMHWNKNYKNFGATDLSKTSEEECAL